LIVERFFEPGKGMAVTRAAIRLSIGIFSFARIDCNIHEPPMEGLDYPSKRLSHGCLEKATRLDRIFHRLDLPQVAARCDLLEEHFNDGRGKEPRSL
jgi:hypothetical protein